MVQGSKGQNGIYYLNQFGPVPLILVRTPDWFQKELAAQIDITLWISEEM